MALLTVLDFLLVVVGFVGLAYQVVCIITSFVAKPLVFPQAPRNKHYAVLISARNESKVIGDLITTLQEQDYPAELIDVWLCADNCTDNTAEIVRSMGCNVVERHNKKLIGKGYALTYLLNYMIQVRATDIYDGYFIFDADNLLDRHYISEMNNVFQAGYEIVTSYRNSRNFAENWVSSGSALWFVRESRFLNSSRMILGNSCHVGGTGFMFSRKIMERNGGWKFHLMTEDIEFSLDSVIHGDRIGYCGTAMLYDEQPVTFKQSWRQRVRWSKGFLQVFRYYAPRLLHRAIHDRDFSAIDLTLLICPFSVLSALRVILGVLFASLNLVSWSSQWDAFMSFLIAIVWSLVIVMVASALTVIAERDKIGVTNKELIAYCLSFPVYVLSYIPISYQAIFSKPDWKPIEHHGSAPISK